MDYAQVEEQFTTLKQQFTAGTLDEAAFKARLNELMVQDGQGRWWMIGYETGQWYMHDGAAWVRSDPPGRAAPAPAQPTKASAAAAPAAPVEKARSSGAQPAASTTTPAKLVEEAKPGGAQPATPLANPAEKSAPETPPPAKAAKKLGWEFWVGWIGSLVLGISVVLIFVNSIQSATVAGIIFGTIVGCLQWLVIRRSVQLAGLWIIANLTILIIIGAWHDSSHGSVSLLVLFIFYLIANLVAGPIIASRGQRTSPGTKA